MKKLAFLLVGLFLTTSLFAQLPKIEYVISMDEPHTHYFDIEVKASHLDAKTKQQGFLDFKMAVWTPGSYLIREYAKNVEALKASSAQKGLKSEKINKNTWRVYFPTMTNELTLNYKVYANELSVRTSFVDASHGYMNPASVLVYVNDWKNNPSTLLIKPYKTWSTISTGLKALGNNRFEAQNLDNLIDSPIEIGNQKILSFNLKGIPHTVAMYGEASFDDTKVTNDIQKVCEAARSVVGEHPCKDYTFLIHNLAAGGGGLEHLNSTTCQVTRTAYQSAKGYQDILSLIAQEYFHLWNVKRIRPKALGPFDYENENYTHLLWFSEGCTSFYQNYILRRANLMTEQEYLTAYLEDVNFIENQTGNQVQSVAESSWDAWIKYYRPNENSRNSTVSYYDKGAVLGGILNLEILRSTQGTKNLDDVMRYLYKEYYQKLGRGFSDEELQKAVEFIAGKKLDTFFQKYIFGTETIPYNEYFASVGMTMVDKNANTNTPYLGAEFRGGGLKITSIQRNSPAYNDGLNYGDEIISIDGAKIEDLAKFMTTKKVGDVLDIKVKRDGLEKSFKVTLTRNPKKDFALEPIVGATPTQLALYKKWLFL